MRRIAQVISSVGNLGSVFAAVPNSCGNDRINSATNGNETLAHTLLRRAISKDNHLRIPRLGTTTISSSSGELPGTAINVANSLERLTSRLLVWRETEGIVLSKFYFRIS